MKYIKLVLGILLGVIVIIGGIAVFLLSRNEIPKTTANVNDRPIGELVLEKGKLENYWGESLQVEYGSLVVPENRKAESPNHLSVAFLRIPTSNSVPLSPIFFLAGGPGTPGSSIARSRYFYVFKELARYGDVVILDQRGTGRSVPNLSCRNKLSLPVDVVSDVEKKIFEDLLNKCRECADEFREMNIDLPAFNSVESAEDIDAIRTALDYDRISLYGYSYGSSLAQHYIKAHKENVEKAIFAGPTAPDLSIKLPDKVEDQFQQMEILINKDKRFENHIPDLLELMESVHTQLETQPTFIKIPFMDAVSEDDGVVPTTIFKTISLFKPYWKLTLTDLHLQMISAQNIGNDYWISRFPEFYYQMSEGNYRDVGNILRNFRRQAMPNALFFTVNGTTGYNGERWAEAVENDSALLSHFSISFGRYKAVSESFGVKPVKGFNRPVSSTVDLLLIGGSLDSRTPLSNLDSLSRRFPNSKKIVVMNAGHNDLIDNAISDNMLRFLKGEMIENDTIIREVTFIPPVPYKKSLTDTLEHERSVNDINSAIDLYHDIASSYSDQHDFIYDLSESSLNNFGYVLLGKGWIDDALEIFKLNTQVFPDRYNVYNSLGEAYLEKGDTLNAKRELLKAIDLNFLDGYSHALLWQLNQ